MGVLAVLALGLGACHKADPVGDLEKAAAAMEATGKAPPPAGGKEKVASGDYDPAVAATIPAQQVKEAISEFKAGKMEDAVTRLQLLRSQPIMSPQQRMALQDSMGTLMTEIYTLAEKGDARAKAAVAQYERMQTAPH